MDAFCGFVRGIRGKSEELHVFPVENAGFFQPIFNHLLGEFYLARPFG